MPKKDSIRSKFCFDLTRNLLPDTWSSIIAKIRPSPLKQKERIREVFKKLKNTFCQNLLNASWIDSFSQIRIINKCQSIEIELFKPPKDEVLENTYNSLTLSGDYQRDLVALLINYRRKMFSLFDQPLSVDLL